MKAFNAIFKYGNLYDRDTKKRILIEDGSEISITLNEQNILITDPNIKPQTLLNAEQKQNAVLTWVGGSTKVWKLLESDTLLYFQITAGVKKENVTHRIFSSFQVKLLEDLYLYNKKKEANDARFCECHCLVECCINDSIDFFEPIYATSLNDAYTKTYELYFAMYGKSTCNAFDRFYEDSGMRVPIRGKTLEIQKQPSVK